jgi:transcriptional regulator with XRE-family HTH domain
MITRIRDVRRARGMTLAEVAGRCIPPTTAQTIGRLETGTRTVSVGWLNRIARALDVETGDLVQLPDTIDLPVVAILGAAGVSAPRRARTAVPPRPRAGAIALVVEAGQGDYRAGDTLWLDRVGPDDFAQARNRDVLVPLPAGRFRFGRLIGLVDEDVELLPTGAGIERIAAPAWIGIASLLVRAL